jgi:hypothetical protein
MTISQTLLRIENNKILANFTHRAEKIIQYGNRSNPLMIKTEVVPIFMPTVGNRKQFFEGESITITDRNGIRFLL